MAQVSVCHEEGHLHTNVQPSTMQDVSGLRQVICCLHSEMNLLPSEYLSCAV